MPGLRKGVDVMPALTGRYRLWFAHELFTPFAERLARPPAHADHTRRWEGRQSRGRWGGAPLFGLPRCPHLVRRDVVGDDVRPEAVPAARGQELRGELQFHLVLV